MPKTKMIKMPKTKMHFIKQLIHKSNVRNVKRENEGGQSHCEFDRQVHKHHN